MRAVSVLDVKIADVDGLHLLKYCEYSRSSRLAGGAPRRRMTIRMFVLGPLASASAGS